MASLADAFVEIDAITRKHRKQRVTSSVAEHNALLSILKEKNKIRHDVDGGTEIVEPVALLENSTIQNYSGFDPLNDGDSESTFPARFGWAQKAIHVAASGKELRMNSGKNAMVRLVKMKQQIAEETAANRMAIELYGDGTGYEAIDGLQTYLTTNGAGIVGGIDSSVYTNWQNKVYEMPGTDAWSSTTIEEYFATLYKKCVVGKDRPDLIMASHDIYTALEKAIMEKTRYQGYMDQKKANFDFEHIIFKNNVPVHFDSNVNFGETAERAYFLNCDHLYLVEHPQAKWDFEEGRKATNVDGVFIPAYWMGNLITKKRRTSGLLIDAA